MIEWSYLREQIRRTILLDTNESRPKWSDDSLRDAIWWAMDSLCAHTAAVTSVTLTADGSTQVFDLPDNVFILPDEAGSVYFQRGFDYTYYGRFMVDHEVAIEDMFSITNNQINFIVAPIYDITVQYYAYYNHPYADSDMVSVPRWAVPAIAYLAASFATAGQAVKTGNIRQYAENPDRGDPEDNPFIQQSEFFQGTYYSILKRYKPQDRKFYRPS